MTTPICIEKDPICIRTLQDRDLEGLIRMRRNAQTYRYEPAFLTELQGTPEEALHAIQQMDLKRDRQCILGIFTVNTPDTLIGLAELYDYKPDETSVSIGFRLIPECCGRGIVSDCLPVLLDYLKENTSVRRVIAHVLPENTASARCAKKNGFRYLHTRMEDWGQKQLLATDVYVLEYG